MPGYSGTPLAKKLGYKPGTRACAVNAPAGYRDMLDGLPDDVEFVRRLAGKLDLVHVFVTERADMEQQLRRGLTNIAPDGMIWVSWPKKAAKVPTDITEDVIREVALPMGLVDVKVCAVDSVWSGLKLVIRKELRKR